MEYHIRYTCSGEVQDNIVNFIMRNADKYIISREIASREHIQCYVVTNVVKKTWVNKFNATFKGMDRRDKYVELDKGNTIGYVCKGQSIMEMPIILGKRGFTDDDIISYHKKYWETKLPELPECQAEVMPEVKQDKARKAKQPPFMKVIRNQLDESFPDKDWSMVDKPVVFKFIMRGLGESCKSLDHIIISRMTYGILNSLIKDKKEWHEYWYKKAFNELLNCDEVDDRLDEI